jgi:hypothetical protein
MILDRKLLSINSWEGERDRAVGRGEEFSAKRNREG